MSCILKFNIISEGIVKLLSKEFPNLYILDANKSYIYNSDINKVIYEFSEESIYHVVNNGKLYEIIKRDENVKIYINEYKNDRFVKICDILLKNNIDKMHITKKYIYMFRTINLKNADVNINFRENYDFIVFDIDKCKYKKLGKYYALSDDIKIQTVKNRYAILINNVFEQYNEILYNIYDLRKNESVLEFKNKLVIRIDILDNNIIFYDIDNKIFCYKME